MTEIYTGQEYDAEFKIKKRMFTVWLIMLAVYIAVSVFILVSFVILPYGTKNTVFITSNVALSTLFWGYSLLFFSTKFYRLRKYVKMLGYLRTGIKENYNGEFLRFESNIEVKEGVEFYTMISKEWNQRKQEFFERKVLIDNEKSKPDIAEGARIRYVTQGNILIKYKVLGTAVAETNEE